MRTLLYGVSCLIVIAAAPLVAQENELPAPSRQPNGTVLETTPSRSEPAYERYVTTREAIQRRAAIKAAQRRERIAVNKALGYSPSRPPASPVPWMGSYGGRPIVVRYTQFPGMFFPSR